LRGITRRIRVGFISGNVRTLTSVALASIAVPTVIGLQAAPAADAAAVPPTITSAFTPNLIGVGDTDATALSVTITNPNASGTLSSVAFTDTLPAGLTVDNPNGESGTCGSTSVVTAAPGSSSLSVTGGSLKAGATCTVSVSLIASQTGTLTNTPSAVTSSAGASAVPAAQTLTVLPPPTVSVGGIKNNATYTFGESVRPHYTCTQPADAAALADCSAADDLGNAVVSGGALDTKDPGSHTLTVSSTSTDGLETDDSFSYTVLANNKFTVAKVKPGKHGTLAFQLALPGAGPVKVVEIAGKSTVGTYNRDVGGKKTINVTVRPTHRGVALLAASSPTKPRLKVTLQITYTPKGGVKRTVTKRGIVLS
jgi:hypothetical protein